MADEAVTIGDVEFSRNVLAIRFTEQKRLVQIIDVGPYICCYTICYNN